MFYMLMGLTLSGIFLFLEQGLNGGLLDWLSTWLWRFVRTYVVVVSVVLMVSPIANWLTVRILRRWQGRPRP